VRDSKLFELLKSLSAYEMKRLGNYIQSPYINSNAQVVSLHQLISKNHPDYNSGSTDKKILFKNLFPQRKYEDKKIRYLFTDYTRLLENFLIDESLDRDESLKEQILRKELASRNCSKAYRTKFQSGISHPTEDADYFLHQYQAAYTHLDLWLSRQKRKEEQNIEAVIENLDKFYFAKKLELSCAVQSFRNVLAINYKNNFGEELAGLIQSHEYGKVPVILIYRQILLTLTKENDEKHFDRLLEIIPVHEKKFSLQQLREIYQYAMNYCIKKINKGNTAYFKTLFELYKIILPKKILMQEKFLPQFDYKNIVTIALRMKELPWAKKFIEEYKLYLRKEERENAYTYNLAHWHFHNRDYSKTLSLFQRVEFTDIYYQLDTRSIVLKTYFEQDDAEAFFYHASAFRTYIRRNKLVSDYQRTSYRNFIKYTGQLLRANGNLKKISMIKKALEEKKQVADINWLLQKTEEV
jgi:hypothetical protein